MLNRTFYILLSVKVILWDVSPALHGLNPLQYDLSITGVTAQAFSSTGSSQVGNPQEISVVHCNIRG